MPHASRPTLTLRSPDEGLRVTRKISLTQQELYEKVWSTPMQKLAKEFGLSDVGLTKLCCWNEIPLPGRGYWARIDLCDRVVIAVRAVAARAAADRDWVTEEIQIQLSDEFGLVSRHAS